MNIMFWRLMLTNAAFFLWFDIFVCLENRKKLGICCAPLSDPSRCGYGVIGYYLSMLLVIYLSEATP